MGDVCDPFIWVLRSRRLVLFIFNLKENTFSFKDRFYNVQDSGVLVLLDRSNRVRFGSLVL